MFSIVLLATLATAAQAPAGWDCDAALFADGTCDCGCGADDDDCASTEFDSCVRDNCPAGQAPWEHENSSCMASTCGDGWKAADEACDDFNGLASGGCNADCSAVNAGFTCGERAEGCTAVAEGEGEGEPAEGEGEPAEGEGESEDDDTGGGCAAAPAAPLGLLAVSLVALARRRRR
jgi:cysteine-rich repeat protein